ncbi:MAG: flagellar hook-length control protein FliK [Syntrophales bacterium]
MTTILAPTTKIATVTEIVRPPAGTNQDTLALSLGDTVEAAVVKSLPDNQYLLNIKNASVLADSQVQLTAGEKITVQVERLTPGILLRMTSTAQGEADVINKYLLLHRSNPAALGELFSKIGEIIINAKTLPPSLTKIDSNLEKISQISEKILISGINRSYVNNLTGYAKSLGLNMEYDLVKTLVQGSNIAKGDDRTSVKGLFMDILNNLNAFMDDVSNLNDALLNHLKQLRTFTEESISSLETHQIINVLSRESDGPFILQLPFAFPEGVRMQNIYIEREKEKREEEGGKSPSFRMTIFLDLDQMGEITLDTRFQGKKIDCVFHCQNDDISNFISAYLEELKEILEGAGYDVGGLQCLVEDNVRLMRHEYLARQPFNNRLVLNLFA